MLARNKILSSSSPEYIPGPPIQQQHQRYDERDFLWRRSAHHDFSRREYPGESHYRSQRHDDQHQNQHPYRDARRPSSECEDTLSFKSRLPLPLPQEPILPSHRSNPATRPATIHPTIANMVSPTSPRIFSQSPPPAASTSSYRHRSYSPASSLSSRDVSVSPELESGKMVEMRHPSDRRLRHQYHQQHNRRQPLSSSPSPQSDGAMEMDHDYAFEELSSDSMMDQCEPQRGWSSSLSQQTSSPSPVMSCTPYQFPPKPRQHKHKHEHEHQHEHEHRHQHHQPSPYHQDYYPHQAQHPSELPPPQQQPARDQHVQISSTFDYRSDEHRELQRHQYGDQQREPGLWIERSSSSSSSSSSVVATSSTSRRNSLKVVPTRRSRTHPFSVVHDTDVGPLRHYSSPKVGSSCTFRQSADVYHHVHKQQRGSMLTRCSTPPFLQLPPPQHTHNIHSHYLHRQASEMEGGVQQQQQQQQQQKELVAEAGVNSIAFPPLKTFISEAQRMLYERHPPSPKCGRSLSSSNDSPSSPSTASNASAGSSAQTSPMQSIKRGSFDLEQSVGPIVLPPPHRRRSSAEFEDANRSSHHLEYVQEQQQQKKRQQRHSWPNEFQQQPQRPTLPRIASFELQSRHSHRDTESYPGSQGHFSRSSMSSISNSSASLPSPTITGPPSLPSYATPLHSSSSATCTAAGNTGIFNVLPNLPGTDGMTVVRNEEGAIMVYNPLTEAMTFRCELCPGESFGRIHDLKRHQTSKHQEMTWPCDFCHRPFVRRDALLRHYTVKAARDDGLHPASHEVDKLLAARARAKMLY